MAYVLGPALVAELATGKPAEVEREWGFREPELLRKGDSSLAGGHCFRKTPRDGVIAGEIAVGTDELRAMRLRLEKLDRLGDHVPASRIPEPMGDEGQSRQDTSGRDSLAPVAVEVEGLLDRLPGIGQSTLLLRCVRPALEQ